MAKETRIFNVKSRNNSIGVSLSKGDIVITNDNGAQFTSPVSTRADATPESILDYSHKGLSFWSGTQAEYDLLTPDNDTIYFIV